MLADKKMHLYKGLANRSKTLQNEVQQIFRDRRRNGLSCNSLSYFEVLCEDSAYCLLGHGWEMEFLVENSSITIELLIASGNDPVLEAKEMRNVFFWLASKYRDFKFRAHCNDYSLRLIHKLRDRVLLDLEENEPYRDYTNIEFSFTELFFIRYGKSEPIELEIHDPKETTDKSVFKILRFKPKKRT